MLAGLKDVLEIAEKGGFAVPAFNVYNMETVMGIVEAAEEAHAPIIMQSYSRLFTNREGYFVTPIALAAAEQASVPICFHLDHGAGKAEVTRALRYGATGIMIDKSTLPFAENAAQTKEVVELAAAVGVHVEGELGHIGSARDGVPEDCTEVQDAAEFVEKTGVAALAVMVGTAHGRYKKAPKLAVERIAELYRGVGAHLVLHGGSGVPDAEIQAAVAAGIRKVNFGTDVCYAFLDKVFETSRELVAIDMFMKDAIENVKKVGLQKIKLLGAENRV